MNYFRHLISSAIVGSVALFGSAYAFEVSFESNNAGDRNYSGVGLLDRFVDGNVNLFNANGNHRLLNEPLGAPPFVNLFGLQNGITFSGGVLLEDPLNSDAMPIMGDGGSVYYGTAFSPSTAITTSNYTSTLAIDITSAEMVQSVSGSFVHGLDTRLDGSDVLIDYVVNYFVDGVADPFTQVLAGQVFDNGDSVISFGLDIDTLAGVAMGAFITRVELTTAGYDFLNGPNARSDDLEYDFLLSSVSFNEGASPVPVPAALPLFMSALLGGFVAARRKKSSDHKISS